MEGVKEMLRRAGYYLSFLLIIFVFGMWDNGFA